MHVFNSLFIALKPCIDGFLAGCRPYLGVDAIFLTGKYTGQLAAIIGVDGHSWMFPVAFGIFEKENKENWVWFMEQLKLAIREPQGFQSIQMHARGWRAPFLRFTQIVNIENA